MRKQYLILIAILIPVNIICQNNSLELGLIGGPEYFSVRGFDTADENYKGALGYSTGIMITLRNTFALNTGLLYEDNRFLIKNENNPQHNFLGQGNISLLRIPINVDINLNEYLFMKVGIYTGIIRHVSTEIYEYGGFPEIVTDLTEDVQFADFGLTGGLGFQHYLSDNARLYIILENNLGLLNINKNENESSPFKLNGINLSLGLSYKIN